MSFSRFSLILENIYAEEYWDKMTKFKELSKHSKSVDEALDIYKIKNGFNTIISDYLSIVTKTGKEKIENKNTLIQEAENNAERIMALDRG